MQVNHWSISVNYWSWLSICGQSVCVRQCVNWSGVNWSSNSDLTVCAGLLEEVDHLTQELAKKKKEMLECDECMVLGISLNIFLVSPLLTHWYPLVSHRH